MVTPLFSLFLTPGNWNLDNSLWYPHSLFGRMPIFGMDVVEQLLSAVPGAFLDKVVAAFLFVIRFILLGVKVIENSG